MSMRRFVILRVFVPRPKQHALIIWLQSGEQDEAVSEWGAGEHEFPLRAARMRKFATLVAATHHSMT